MRSARLGALTGVAIVLGAAAGTGAERSPLVRARVFITGGVRSFRHQISVRSKDPSRQVVSVLVGQLPGLPEEPTSLKVPPGWEGRVLKRERGGWVTWAVEVSCLADASPTGQPGAERTAEPGGCGLRAGESLTFEFSLRYPAEHLRRDWIYLGFSDGRTGIAG